MYRSIETSFWRDPKIKKLPLEVKLLAVYLFSNDMSHVSGIYLFRKSVACEDLGMSRDEFDQNFSILIEKSFCHWDEDREVIWVVNMFKRQNADKSPRIVKGLPSHLGTLYESPLISEFLKYYSQLNIPFQNPPKRVRKPRRGITKYYREDQDQEQDIKGQDRDQEQVQEKNPTPPNGGGSVESGLNRAISDNSQIYDRFINLRREAIGIAGWQPTASAAIQMRANIKLFLASYSVDQLLGAVNNYFKDGGHAKRKWPWAFFAADPVAWISATTSTDQDKPPPKDLESEERKRFMDERRARLNSQHKGPRV